MIEAAGGLLWRRGPKTTREIAVVHRSRYGDWTLPKGKLEAGETAIQAALREVREETGYRARIVDFAGAIGYDVSNGPKVVHFWNMVPESDVQQATDQTEVAEVLWMPPNEAIQKLTHPLEQSMVGAHMQNPMPSEVCAANYRRSFLVWVLHWWKLKDIAYESLILELPLAKREFENLRAEVVASGTTANQGWDMRIGQLLQCAEDQKWADPEISWRFVKAAQRVQLYAQEQVNPGEAEARAQTLLKEAKEKIGKWRLEVIQQLLTSPDGQMRVPVPVWKVVRAAKIADEHFDNTFRRLKILRKRLRLFGALSVLITVLYIALADRAGILSKIVAGHPCPWLAIAALAFMGLMGAVVSVLTSTKSASDDRVPVQQAQTAVLGGRLAVGPLSALAAATFLQTGILNGYVPSYDTALAISVVSGFSERFVLNAIDAFSKKS